jgi:hypothetical protein
MPYPQITDYQEAVQHPVQSFTDPELKQAAVAENTLGLPLVMSGGFALTYALTTPRHKCAVRCFHREIPAIQQKYHAIAKQLRRLGNDCFVNFEFQQSGISVRQQLYPIVRMDWVEGDTLGVWLDKHYDDARALKKARADFTTIARFLERKGIAHGDIQNGNVMIANGAVKLIDYDGMFVPGMRPGNGSEIGHRHFQHPDRRTADFGPKMDRFSFIALDLSLDAVSADKTLYPKFREGGETIIFKANDFADPQNSEIFGRLTAMREVATAARNFAAICEAPLKAVPTLDDFLAGRNIPAGKTPITVAPSPILTTATKTRPAVYIGPYPVVDALNFAAALQRVGDRVELIGRIVEIKPGMRKRGKGPAKHYVFINFGSWRGNIVKISIWSEGLAKLKEKPSNAWIGRWVSVTGLMEVPYENKRAGYKHLSITVQEDGQIQVIDESEAGFRLASAATAPPAPLRAAATAIAKAAKPKKGSSSRGSHAAKRQRTRSAPTASSGAQRPAWLRRFAARPRWLLASGGAATLVALLVATALAIRHAPDSHVTALLAHLGGYSSAAPAASPPAHSGEQTHAHAAGR